MGVSVKEKVVINITVSEDTAAALAAVLGKFRFPKSLKTGLFGLRNDLEGALAEYGVPEKSFGTRTMQSGRIELTAG